MGPVVGRYFDESASAWKVYTYASYPSPGVPARKAIVPNPGDDRPYAEYYLLAINNLGQVAGSYQYPLDPTNNDILIWSSFLYSPGTSAGTITLPNPPGAVDAFVSSINDAGWIIGWYYDANYSSHCMIYKPPYAEAFVFESLGGVANCSDISPGNNIQDGGRDPMWDVNLNPLSINGLGQIAGTVGTPNPDAYTGWPFQGFSSGVSVVVDAEGGEPGASSEARIVLPAASNAFYSIMGLNNNGQFVGEAWSAVGCTDSGCTYPPYDYFLINTDGSLQKMDPFAVRSLNDDVQMTDWNEPLSIVYPQN
jgi:hypothetical protein